jgi:cytochrome P450
VARVGLPGGGTAWAVSRLADVRELLVSPSISADPRRPGFPDPYPEHDEDGSEEGSEDGELPRLLLEMGAPEHTAYRRMLIGELAVKRVNQLRPGIQALADGLVDDLLRHGPPADLVTAFSLPVPSTVICQLATAPTSASGRTWPRRSWRSPTAPCSPGSRRCASPCRWTSSS